MDITKCLNIALWLSLVAVFSLIALAPTILGVEAAAIDSQPVAVYDFQVEEFVEVEAQPEDQLQQALDWSYYLESTWGKKLMGDNGNAIGPLHTWKIVVDDVNRIVGSKQFRYEDRWELNKSCQLFSIYLSYYGQKYQEKTGQDPTVETYVRMWNGGPDGWQKADTLDHWARVVNYNQ